MSGDFRIPGGGLLARMGSWMASLVILAVMLEILVAALVHYVTILAPWILLAVVVVLPVVVLLRRRSLRY